MNEKEAGRLLREEFLLRQHDMGEPLFPYNIVLVGFMGTGKSTIAALMQEAFGMEVIEMDQVIARQQGMSIPEIFEKYGEEYFRNLETQLLIDMQNRSNAVISCGGGVALRERNVTEMKKNGRVVLLTAAPGTILDRVKDDDNRPLLRGHKDVEYISGMMEERRPKYEAAADIIVSTDGKTALDICREIVLKCRKNPVTVRNIKIGEGTPKICVPLVGRTKEEILAEAEKVKGLPVDMAEWRGDWFSAIKDPEQVRNVLTALRKVLPDLPLLFTFRTSREGGEQEISIEEYRSVNRCVIKTGLVDLIDVELFIDGAASDSPAEALPLSDEPSAAGRDEGTVEMLIREAHACGVKVIVSNHDFEMTPPEAEILHRLRAMERIGADIAKIAVMPLSRKDVLALLAATEQMYRTAAVPVVTMSMSGQGAISRLCGEVFGSAITFGSAGRASAPGQIAVEELREVLRLIHASL